MLWILGICWIVCGILSYGGLLARYQRAFPEVCSKADGIFCVFMSLAGPLSFVIALIFTKFFLYGFQFIPIDSDFAKKERKSQKEIRKKYWSRGQNAS